jgi:parallel beta-helix repeat protein
MGARAVAVIAVLIVTLVGVLYFSGNLPTQIIIPIPNLWPSPTPVSTLSPSPTSTPTPSPSPTPTPTLPPSPTVSNSHIQIGNGEYLITSALTLNNVENVSITLGSNARFYRDAVGYNLIFVNASRNIEISGGIFDGVMDDTTESRDTYNSCSIKVLNSVNVTISNAKFLNASDDAIWIENSNQTFILNNNIETFYKHAITIYSTARQLTNNFTIQNNTVNANYHQVYDGITVYAKSATNGLIINNTARNLHNIAYSYDQSGIHIEDYDDYPQSTTVLVTQNSVFDCKFGITTATANYAQVINNTVTNCTRGIFLWHPIGNVIVNNTLNNCQTDIFTVGGSNNTISNNTVNNYVIDSSPSPFPPENSNPIITTTMTQTPKLTTTKTPNQIQTNNQIKYKLLTYWLVETA